MSVEVVILSCFTFFSTFESRNFDRHSLNILSSTPSTVLVLIVISKPIIFLVELIVIESTCNAGYEWF